MINIQDSQMISPGKSPLRLFCLDISEAAFWLNEGFEDVIQLLYFIKNAEVRSKTRCFSEMFKILVLKYYNMIQSV